MLKLETLLDRTGDFDAGAAGGPTGFPGSRLDTALKGFQTRHGLKPDGLVEPKGPTLAALKRSLAPAEAPAARPAPTAPKRKPVPVARKSLLHTVAETATAAATTAVPQVPSYRRGYEANPRWQQGWRNWYEMTESLPDASPLERDLLMELFAAEGGLNVDSESGAVAGITPETLNGLIARKWIKDIEKGTRPADLEPEQLLHVTRVYFDDVFHTVGGRKALNAIGDQNAAVAFADSMFAHGRSGGAHAIQQAINDVAPGRVPVDGAMGPQTLNAYKARAADPETRRALLDALGERRWNRVKERDDARGWRRRIDHFRFQ